MIFIVSAKVIKKRAFCQLQPKGLVTGNKTLQLPVTRGFSCL